MAFNKKEPIQQLSASTRLYLPPIPRSRKKKFADVIKANNKAISKEKTWVLGLY